MSGARLGGELVAEFIGAMVLVMFGMGVCAMVALFGKGVPGEVVFGGAVYDRGIRRFLPTGRTDS